MRAKSNPSSSRLGVVSKINSFRSQRASGTATAPPPPTTRRGDAGTASRELRLLDTALAPPTPAACSRAAIVNSLPNRKHP
ncbi:hypothetical protein CCHR01_14303 [Colletotrichum chrysophilum]|uniref:Uncharacterized protein n=1 Tax=Colletotrichum chrysophilum TaxID=1836956 RepID=A0AAD9A8U8_9PEZI|nr:hypothetical protein CCHR01_14303 [Colletotrichum chrysophilum]